MSLNMICWQCSNLKSQSTILCNMYVLFRLLKEQFTQKKKIVSSFTHPQVGPSPYDLYFFRGTQKEMLRRMTASVTIHFHLVCFPYSESEEWLIYFCVQSLNAAIICISVSVRVRSLYPQRLCFSQVAPD